MLDGVFPGLICWWKSHFLRVIIFIDCLWILYSCWFGFLLRQELSGCRYRRLEIEDVLFSMTVEYELIYGISSLNLCGISIKRWMVFLCGRLVKQ